MRARGFTLIELMVALLVSVLTVAAGVVLLITSQQWFQSGTDERAMQETARVAMDELTTTLRAAGYGLEPTFAFDTGVLANVPQDSLPQGLQARFGGYHAGQRDSTSAPDELVFYSRNPGWARDVSAVSPGTPSLTLVTPPTGSPAAGKGPDLHPGQILQVMCYGANNQWLWAYVSVSRVDTSDPTQSIVVLEANTGLAYDFPHQNALLNQACFAAGAASVRAFKVDRYRFYIAAVDAAGNVQGWETAGTRPYLMLDQGLSADGAPVLTPIAPDVEDLQVAYVFPLAPNGQIVGADPGVAVVADTGGDDAVGFNLAPLAPFIIPYFSAASADLDVARTSHHPANIRAVRVAITVRTPRIDTRVGDATVPAALNRADVPNQEAGYRRMVFESTAYTRNLETVLPLFPTYDPNFASNCCPPGGPCAGNCGGG